MQRTMLKLANYFWVLACKCFLRLWGFIFRYIFRLNPVDSCQTKDSDFKDDHFQQDNEIDFISESEEVNHEFVFGFGFQKQSGLQKNPLNQDTSEYLSICTEDFRGSVEETETVTVSVQESFAGRNDSPCLGPTDDAPIVNNENQDSENSKAEEFVETQCSENTAGKEEISSDCNFPAKNETAGLDINHSGPDYCSHDIGLNSQNPFWRFDWKPTSSISTKGFDSATSDFYPVISEQERFQRTEGKWKSEESMGQGKSWDSDFEDGDEFDILLKHQESIEQMKVEMKNARSKGFLPIILEESDTPKMVEDLKPLRVDEKFGHKDRLEEIQNVYKGYAEKMRKLDVLNYQTLHAISFLQLKYQFHQGSTQKSSVSTIKSLLFPNSWKMKLQRVYDSPMLKSITDLHRNLELVYVGQTCLSWEILHWQYAKAKELLEDDFEGCCSYNEVAGEFQQFQVLVQRFVENETFKGPRVQNYTKNRCDTRSLLHVPAIKDDYLMDKNDIGVEEDHEVSAAMLAQIIDESMRVFWEFLQADRDGANVVLKGIQSTIADLPDPSDSELLVDIKTSLQKKEKRLKDLLRSGNCITKKFQKHHGSRVEGKLLFVQVELKLISMVLNMSRLSREQLIWCQKKLNKIDFLKRKLHVEPSFFLFPLWGLKN